MPTKALSHEAVQLVEKSFATGKEVSFALCANHRRDLTATQVRWGSENKVSIAAAPVILHTHPKTCTNHCTRPRGSRRRVCKRDQDECIVGVPSAADLRLTLRYGLLGVCKTHIIASKQDGVYVLHVHANLPGIFQRLVDATPGVSPLDAATALADLAFEQPNSIEDEFEDRFNKTTYASWRTRWTKEIMRPGVRLFGICAIKIQHVQKITSIRV